MTQPGRTRRPTLENMGAPTPRLRVRTLDAQKPPHVLPFRRAWRTSPVADSRHLITRVEADLERSPARESTERDVRRSPFGSKLP